MLFKKTLISLSCLCLIFNAGVTANAFAGGFDTYSDIDAGSYSSLDSQAVGIELRGLFDSSSMSVSKASLSAVSYSPFSALSGDDVSFGSMDSLLGLHDGYYSYRMPLVTYGDVKYPGLVNMLNVWSEHDFALDFAMQAALAETAITAGYVLGAVAVSGTAAVVVASASDSGDDDDSSSRSGSGSGSSSDGDSDDGENGDQDDGQSGGQNDDRDDDHDGDRDDDHDDGRDDDRDDDHDDGRDDDHNDGPGDHDDGPGDNDDGPGDDHNDGPGDHDDGPGDHDDGFDDDRDDDRFDDDRDDHRRF